MSVSPLRLLLAAVIASVCACGRADTEGGSTLHYRPTDGWVGDMHPLYWGDRWHVYSLQVPLAPLRNGLDRLRSIDTVGSDLIRWSASNPPITHSERPWWAIANVRVETEIYSLCNGPNGFDLAISKDGRTWRPYAANPVVPYPSGSALEVRDPYVCRDDTSGIYYMVAAARKLGHLPATSAGLFVYAKSTDLLHWSSLKPLYDPGDIGIPECPELFKMDKRWYLVGSWGIDRVGQARYRIADSPEGPWRVPALDTLDSTELMAPNSGGDGKRRLLYGWIPTYRGGIDFAPAELGGHMAFPREVRCLPNGELALRLPNEFMKLRQKPVKPSASPQGWLHHQYDFTHTDRTHDGVLWFPGSRRSFEVALSLRLSAACPTGGIKLEAGYSVVVDMRRKLLLLRRDDQPERRLASTQVRVAPGKQISMRVIVDGDIVEAFVDDRYSLAGRAMGLTGPCRAGVFIGRGQGTVSHPTLYSIKPIYPAALPSSVKLSPTPDPAVAIGGSVLFAKSGANVYTSFHPALEFAGSFTLECWVKETPGTGGFKANLIARGDGEAPGYIYGLNLTPKGALELYYRSTAGFERVGSAPRTVSTAGKWMHVAGVVDIERKEMRLFCDGRRIATKSIAGDKLIITGNGALRLGYAAGMVDASPFYGLIDDVRIWSCTRSDGQIEAGYKSVAMPDAPCLVVDWDFERERGVLGRAATANAASRYPGILATLYDGATLFQRGRP